jgi:predicted small secreted protein
MKKTILSLCAAVAIALTLTACENDARVVSRNLSQAADNFAITRRIVFFNSMTNDYMLEIIGKCSIDNASTGPNSVAVTCKDSEGDYKKHFFSLSATTNFFAEQLTAKNVSASRYRVTFKPSVIIPDIELR